MIYSDKKSVFDGLLDEDESVSIHHQIIQKLGIKMFKVLNDENHQTVNEGYETVSGMRPLMNFVSGTESIRFFGSKI